MDDIFADHFDKLLGDVCTSDAVRAAESERTIEPLWTALEQSGFLDALVPEASGGAGLSLSEAAPLFCIAGARSCPVPIAETMIARALLSRAGHEIPNGPIVIGTAVGGIASMVPFARIAAYVLLDTGATIGLYERDALDIGDLGIHGSIAARISLRPDTGALAEMARVANGLMPILAVIRAAQIAGAADKVLTLTLAYADERVQFGKKIGRQQALQQNLAVMAELSIMANMAAQIGCAAGLNPSIECAAIAKQITSDAAFKIANCAHAIHGAIGISNELDLQLYTRRLHEWRIADGSESGWAQALGERRLASNEASGIEYVRLIQDA